MTAVRMKVHLEALRPRQWIKSVFVLAPVLFSGMFRSPPALVSAIVAAGVFCLCASAVYLINDVCDAERDRHHPTKRNRPVARGDLSPHAALVIAASLLVPGIAISTALSPWISLIMAIYVVMNLVYSRMLKNEPFLDVMVIALGFVLRVIAGARAVDVGVSHWMILTTFFLALFLGFGKRREEIVATEHAGERREVMRYYSLSLLNGLIFVTAALTIITYSLYALSSRPEESLRVNGFVWTVPLVVFGVFRYLSVLINNDDGGDPADVLLHDRALLADIAIWVGLVIALLLTGNQGAA